MNIPDVPPRPACPMPDCGQLLKAYRAHEHWLCDDCDIEWNADGTNGISYKDWTPSDR